ncbi:VCBS domain-containing protein [Aeromonas hydrophila]|nr:VCBS domain-containing protein [Aeromonas hydrophila]MDD9226603.1 VCBS domain-containing protein [Aeromonas hydrophila]
MTEGGAWTYNVDNSKVEYLGEGETKVETFVVKSVDGTEHTVTVTITGTNDKAIISGDAEGAVTEGNGNIVLSDSGTLTAVDVDGKDADNTFRTDVAAVAHPTEGAPLGSLTITEGGAWTYNVDNSKVEYLGEGETKVRRPLWSSPWTAPSTPSPSPSPAPTTRRSSAAMPRAQ